MAALPRLVQGQRGRRLTREIRRRDLLATGAGGILAGAVSFPAAASDAIEVVAEPIALDPADARRRRVGTAEFLGGVALFARDPRFGGWSDLWLDPDGDRLMMISDRGHWLDGRLLAGVEGGPVAVSAARIGTLDDEQGKPLRRREADAEGLARLPDGGFAVSFEQRHRILRYPAAEPPFSRPPVPFAEPPGVSRAPDNGGIEALAMLPDGRLLAIAEELLEDGVNAAWIGDGASWTRTGYRAAPGFNPCGATLAPDGDLLVLERHVRVLSWAVRLARVPRAALTAPGPLAGAEVFRLAAPLTVDNFEGVAARRRADGATVVTLIADDNFSLFQRTLLFAFALA